MTKTPPHDDALFPFAEGVWIGTAPARILGMPLTATMVVLRLGDGSLLLNESVLFYRPANTLIVADLVHNIGRPHHWWTRCYMQLMGFYGRVALSRMIRWVGFADRRAARRNVESVLALPFDRVIVGHGLPITGGARTALARAYEWLPSPLPSVFSTVAQNAHHHSALDDCPSPQLPSQNQLLIVRPFPS